jgi:asparagine synthase (glutamine-hydrolysing)
VWVDPEAGLALAHRRLAILDLTSAGHQPMQSSSGRWVLAYNGEVYNHLSMREQLHADGAAPEWRGHSDTETLLACFEAWGIERTLRASVGMFAIALWDRAERTLYLARDRIGEKPLYFGWQGDTFLFGSELKALRMHPAFKSTVDRGALALLLRHNYVPGPYSIYAGIQKLPAGTLLKMETGQRDAQPIAWWSLAEVAERSKCNPFSGNDEAACDTRPDDGGRTAWCAVVRRHRLVPGHIVDASTQQQTSAYLHHRILRKRLRRSRSSPGHCEVFGDGSHRTSLVSE